MIQRPQILCIGHAYILAINRSLLRAVASDPDFEITVVCPKTFHGDLRDLEWEAEPSTSPLHLVIGSHARWSRFIHIFHYDEKELRDIIASKPWDLIFSWEEPYVYSGWQISRAVKAVAPRSKFCFLTAQNLNKTYPPPFNWFERQTVRRADAWLACGHLVIETMTKRGYDPHRGTVLPLTVDASFFRPLDAQIQSEVLAELALKPPVIGFLGRLQPEKGIGILLRALERIPVGQPWSLLCLGSGPEELTILKWAASHGWEDRVRVRLVEHHQVPRYLGAVDLLVAPSQSTYKWKEQFGRMIIEAFACGVPVIGSDSGEIPYVVKEAGMIVPEADPQAWTQAITQLLTDPGLRKTFATRGLERVFYYSATYVAGEYREFFRSLCSR
jgi:glycosyltransferase involved in cell wall biosynthesis